MSDPQDFWDFIDQIDDKIEEIIDDILDAADDAREALDNAVNAAPRAVVDSLSRARATPRWPRSAVGSSSLSPPSTWRWPASAPRSSERWASARATPGNLRAYSDACVATEATLYRRGALSAGRHLLGNTPAG